jgi:hypothetical protein
MPSSLTYASATKESRLRCWFVAARHVVEPGRRLPMEKNGPCRRGAGRDCYDEDCYDLSSHDLLPPCRLRRSHAGTTRSGGDARHTDQRIYEPIRVTGVVRLRVICRASLRGALQERRAGFAGIFCGRFSGNILARAWRPCQRGAERQNSRRGRVVGSAGMHQP